MNGLFSRINACLMGQIEAAALLKGHLMFCILLRGNMRIKFIHLLIIGFLLLALPSLPVEGDETRLFLITDLNAEAFPEIQVNFRVVDSYGKTITDIDKDEISLYENNQPITDFRMIQYNDAPINIIYVIDLGQYTNYNAFGLEYIRRALTFPFLNGYFQDGKDTVQLLGRANDGQLPQTIALFDSSNDGGTFLSYMNSMSFNPSSGLSDALRGIEDALGEMTSLDSLGDSSTSLVFLTHLLDTLSDEEATAFAEQLVLLAREKRVPIFIFQTRIGGGDTQALSLLAQETGGEYLRLMKNQDQRDDFKRIFEEITNQRTHYSLTYRTMSSQSDNRKVSIGPAGSPIEQTTSSMLFAVDVLPPNIEILPPADDTTFTIEMFFESDHTISFQPETLSITAQLTNWPDGYPRHITQATLLVNDEPVETIETAPTDTIFDFNWNIEGFHDEGSFPIPFKVLVVDELGMESASDPLVVNLEFFFMKPTLLQSCLADPIGPPCLTSFMLPLLVVLTLIVIAAIIFFFFLRRRSREAALQDALGTPRETVLVPGKKEKVPGEVLAKLKVLEGPPQMQGHDLEILDYVTHLGRDPDHSTISFFPEGNTSISGKHCTLQLYSGTFYITDNHSLNGTILNDELLEPDKPYELKDGDVIELGDLSVRGVKLKLTILKGAKGHAGADATLYGEREEDSNEQLSLNDDG
jgi:hypothetical protein